MVSQRSHLFNASVRQNLLLANPEASEAQLIEVCQQAQIDEVIQALPGGYDALLGEAAVRLSGGEARRLVIARALLKPAPFLILDEPTEGLDSETERRLWRDLLPLFKERGVILITHRLLALDSFDRICVLEKGRVLESGSHQVLLEKGGRYAGLLDGVG
ncbi:MAG: ATP-binding cassette domain-containing protein [Gammaproteobacteria bacterium]|nr:ATP-binding cassette domain-containing protein [Gammaproteobacteria bacterium]